MFKTKISYFFHPVHDLKLAYTFFKEVMGFNLRYGHLTDITEEKIQVEGLEGLQWLEFDAGNVTLLVQLVPGVKPYETGVGFEVDNCDEAFVFFRNNGVEIARPIEGLADKMRYFEIRDPSGSIFNIFGK